MVPVRGPGVPPRAPERVQLRPRAKSRSRRRWLLPAALAGAALLIAPVLAAVGIGWWLDYSDTPRKSDMIVVLAGNSSRPPYAADLYMLGFAPEIWLARPYREEGIRRAESLGVRIVPEEEISRQILIKKGVPPRKIFPYGDGVLSTAEGPRRRCV